MSCDQIKIGHFYMPHDSVEPITIPEDVVILARRLINHNLERFASRENVSVRKVLERVGQHQQWEGEEKKIVSSALEDIGKDYIHPGHHIDNLNISIALARAYATGRINEVDDEASLQFANERIRRFKHANDHSIDYPRQRMRLSELLQFLENLKNQKPELLQEIHNIRKIPKAEKQHLYEEKGNFIVTPDHFFIAEAEKYGLMNRSQSDVLALRTVLVWYALGFEPKSLESADVLAVFKSILMLGTTKDKQPRFIDDVT